MTATAMPAPTKRQLPTMIAASDFAVDARRLHRAQWELDAARRVVGDRYHLRAGDSDLGRAGNLFRAFALRSGVLMRQKGAAALGAFHFLPGGEGLFRFQNRLAMGTGDLDGQHEKCLCGRAPIGPRNATGNIAAGLPGPQDGARGFCGSARLAASLRRAGLSPPLPLCGGFSPIAVCPTRPSMPQPGLGQNCLLRPWRTGSWPVNLPSKAQAAPATSSSLSSRR